MQYSREKLIHQLNEGEKVKYLFFWGHTADKEEITQSCLSQWYESPFIVEGQTYKTAEHWMMAQKADLFKDTEILDKILSCTKPAEAKKLGRKVSSFEPKVWEEHKYDIVVLGNRHKFSQNPTLLAYLLNTGNRVLVEASPVDKIWGIGMAKDHPNAHEPSAWKGENLLGFALMETRDWLRNPEE